MRFLGQGLSCIGRRGPALLVLWLRSWSSLAPLATAAYQVLPISAFLLTFRILPQCEPRSC